MLQTIHRQCCTITEKAPTRAFCLLAFKSAALLYTVCVRGTRLLHSVDTSLSPRPRQKLDVTNVAPRGQQQRQQAAVGSTDLCGTSAVEMIYTNITTVQYITVQYSTVQYSGSFHNTTKFRCHLHWPGRVWSDGGAGTLHSPHNL